MSAGSLAHARKERARSPRVSHELLWEVASSVTDRDRMILRLLRRHRVLTTSQVKALFFRDTNTCQHRLARLHQLRLVERFRIPAASATAARDRGGWPRVTEYGYVLDRLGAYLVRLERNPDAEWHRERWRTDWALLIATSQRLAHTLGVNQFFVDLTTAAQRIPGSRLVEWWGETFCRRVFDGIVNPDGLGVWHRDGRRMVFLLEYDRGTETLGRLAAKLDGYRRLTHAATWPFTLLVVLPGPRREATARQHLDASGLAVAITNAALATDPAGRIWTSLSTNPTYERGALIDLPAGGG